MWAACWGREGAREATRRRGASHTERATARAKAFLCRGCTPPHPCLRESRRAGKCPAGMECRGPKLAARGRLPMLRSVDLVEVRFDPAGKFVLVAPGTTLLAASQKAGVEIAFGCTRGMCGTDAVAVEPAAALEPPGATERSTLERMG